MSEAPFRKRPELFPSTPPRAKASRLALPKSMPSRVPGILPDPVEWSKRHAPRDVFPSVERLGGVDIFIGGGADDIHWPGMSGVMRDYAERYARETGRPTRYFPNARTPAVIGAIEQASRNGGPVNVVGHSWGGTDAYNAVGAATSRGLRVDNLITLDPVGGNFGLARAGSRSPRAPWIDVSAEPPQRERSDWIASMGGKPSNLPRHAATERVKIPANHDDLAEMMEAGPRAVLDRSRARVGPDDRLPIDAWMAARDRRVERRR